MCNFISVRFVQPIRIWLYNPYVHVQCVIYTLFLLDLSDSPRRLQCVTLFLLDLSDSPPCVQEGRPYTTNRTC